MRKSVLRQSPFVRVSLGALVAISLAFVVAGCGGGGGGSDPNNNNNNNNGQNPTLAFVNGKVTDSTTAHAGVPNATVSVVGTTITAKTATDGSFTLPNVPLNSTQVTVASPDTFVYVNTALFSGKIYDLVLCPIPLPALSAGSNTLVSTISLFPGSQPPPPPTGCPTN